MDAFKGFLTSRKRKIEEEEEELDRYFFKSEIVTKKKRREYWEQGKNANNVVRNDLEIRHGGYADTTIGIISSLRHAFEYPEELLNCYYALYGHTLRNNRQTGTLIQSLRTDNLPSLSIAWLMVLPIQQSLIYLGFPYHWQQKRFFFFSFFFYLFRCPTSYERAQNTRLHR